MQLASTSGAFPGLRNREQASALAPQECPVLGMMPRAILPGQLAMATRI